MISIISMYPLKKEKAFCTIDIVRAMIFSSLVLLFSGGAIAEVIFSENFDAQADWSVSGGGKECNGISLCDGELPTDWTYLRNTESWHPLQGESSSKASQQINNTQYRGENGKSWVRHHESSKDASVDGNTWGDDTMLIKSLGKDYEEVFTSFWIKFDPNWLWASTHTGILKLFRIYHFDGPDGEAEPWNFFSNGDSAPIFLYDLKVSPKWGFRGVYALRCDPQESEYYCSEGKEGDSLFSGATIETPFSDVFGDGQWHLMEFRVKMNTALNTANGVLQVWVDGKLQFDFSDIAWKKTGSSADNGWNMVGIGGNTTNWFAPLADKAEQWYAIDDLVVSTTRLNLPSAPDNVK